MSIHGEMGRRDMLKTVGVAAGVGLAATSGHAACSTCSSGGKDWDGGTPLKGAVKNPGNKAFYKADGAFDAKAAKEAYLAMMRAFSYPIPKVLLGDDLWVCDFLQRDYEKLGMAGIFWKNASGTYGAAGAKAYKGDFADKKYGYLGHEIYLLPGQMLPEHSHIGGPEGYGPKMESWHIRHGSVDFFGEYKGEGNETPISDMPKDEQPWGFGQDWFKSKYVARRKAGDLYTLEDPVSWHFQRAGKNGAIVAEYATYHNHVQFSKPGMEFACSEAK